MTASLRAAAGLLLLTTMACGSDKISVADQEPATSLTITVAASATGPNERSWTLTCEPAAGSHPDTAAACRALAEADEPFAPVPRTAICTDIYGGPAVAKVTGTHRGSAVDARFERTGGCEIARWDRIAAVLGPVPAQPTPPA